MIKNEDIESGTRIKNNKTGQTGTVHVDYGIKHIVIDGTYPMVENMKDYLTLDRCRNVMEHLEIIDK